MKNFGVAEEVIPEEFENFPQMCHSMKQLLIKTVDELSALSEEELLNQRYQRFRKFGIFEEKKGGIFKKK